MSKAQKIIMWVFGLIISAAFYLWGMSMNDYSGNAFIAVIMPLFITGSMLFITFGKKEK
jgi:hypothetical protein